jgi:hypothetical protein
MQVNQKEMSAKSDKKQKVVRAKDFDLKKFVLNTVVDDSTNDPKNTRATASKQWTLFPRYNYGGKASSTEENAKAMTSGDTPAIYTSPISFMKGGIPRIGGEFTKTKKDCTFFWLPLDAEYGGEGATEFEKVLKQLDDHYGGAIKASPDNFVSLKSGKSTKNVVDKLDYGELAKECDPPKTDIPNWRPWNKAKIRIPFKGDDENNPEINVTLSVPNEKTGKPESLEVTSLDELMKHFSYGCKAEFVIKVQTFWILKTADKKARKCGFKLSCDMIRIIERGKASAGVEKPVWGDLIGCDDDLKDEEKSEEEDDTKQTSKPSKKVDDAQTTKSTKPSKKDDSDKDDEEEEVKPSKTAKKTKKDDSDEEEVKPSKPVKKAAKEESDEEEVKPSKPVKKAAKEESDEEEVKPSKTAKKATKEESDEEEEVKPSKAAKKPKKAETDEDEDDEPVKKPAAKGGKDKKK